MALFKNLKDSLFGKAEKAPLENQEEEFVYTKEVMDQVFKNFGFDTKAQDFTSSSHSHNSNNTSQVATSSTSPLNNIPNPINSINTINTSGPRAPEFYNKKNSEDDTSNNDNNGDDNLSSFSRDIPLPSTNVEAPKRPAYDWDSILPKKDDINNTAGPRGQVLIQKRQLETTANSYKIPVWEDFVENTPPTQNSHESSSSLVDKIHAQRTHVGPPPMPVRTSRLDEIEVQKPTKSKSIGYSR